ncbi:NadS family protein [Natronospira bacteriovora]|uniref:NadS family protein n=1 Tax=Natronospira bacteriovora TaxID=3069753 RepID=A0ABU0W835_9GAMM|nr:NadS family protein [Natronospira sp. AB-CW4]MDQ2070156.1 NadS family protein [Natronospira sp. AB-CW4]
MDEKLFAELTESIRQAGEIRRRKGAVAREHRFDPVDVAAVRRQLKLTQDEFAALIGVPVGTLRNWEQNRRQPRGPALALLHAVRNDPEHVFRALSA